MPRKSEQSTEPVVSKRSLRPGGTSIPTDAPSADDFENLGDLPRRYDEDTIFLIAQEPHWLFCYWDLDIAHHPGGPASLRYFRSDGDLEGEIEVPFETRNWYIPVSHAATEYTVEIGFYRGDQWKAIARSVTVKTPPEGLSPSEDFAFATVPFHLSFQRLVDNLRTSAQCGENPVETVARMQRHGDFSAFGLPATAALAEADPLALLAALAGPELLAEHAGGTISSEELHSRVRTRLTESLSSGGGSSEFLPSTNLVAGTTPPGGLASGAFASELLATFSSWSPEEVSSWLEAATVSWSHALGGDSSAENLTSGSEWSGLSGPSSWSLEGISSWLSGAQSSGFPTTLNRWLQGVQSSWAVAATAGWGGPGGESSWGENVDSSWGGSATSSWANGGSEALSSFSSPTSGRDFHLSAEVILHGGTDPNAAVTIDGERILLTPEGTFRYHFVFPNDSFEIPIVTRSPDGVETRSAILSLSRDPEKTGHVSDSAQPPFPNPMGRTR
jgi:hypothetical protein